MTGKDLDEMVNDKIRSVYVDRASGRFGYVSRMVLSNILNKHREELLGGTRKQRKEVIQNVVENLFKEHDINNKPVEESMVRTIRHILEDQPYLVTMRRADSAIFKSVAQMKRDKPEFFGNLNQIVKEYDESVRMFTYFIPAEALSQCMEEGMDSNIYFMGISVMAYEHVYSWEVMPVIEAEMRKLMDMEEESEEYYGEYVAKNMDKLAGEMQGLYDEVLGGFAEKLGQFLDDRSTEDVETDERTVFDA